MSAKEIIKNESSQQIFLKNNLWYSYSQQIFLKNNLYIIYNLCVPRPNPLNYFYIQFMFVIVIFVSVATLQHWKIYWIEYFATWTFLFCALFSLPENIFLNSETSSSNTWYWVPEICSLTPIFCITHLKTIRINTVMSLISIKYLQVCDLIFKFQQLSSLCQ